MELFAFGCAATTPPPAPPPPSLILTPNGAIRGQPRKVAMFGIKLKVLKTSGTLYDLNGFHSSPVSSQPLNGVIRGQPVNNPYLESIDVLMRTLKKMTLLPF